MAFLEFSMCDNLLSDYTDTFTSFPVWISFIFLTSVTAIVRSSKTLLNKSGESGHPCLVPNLKGGAFRFSPLRMMVYCGIVVYGFYYVEVGSLYASFLENFYHK